MSESGFGAPRPTWFERWSPLARSLRFRLMLWNAGAVLATGLAILLAVREGVRFTLLYDTDQVLREDMQEILLRFDGSRRNDWTDLREELNRKARGHDFHDWFVQFYDAAGEPAWASVGAPELPALTEARQQEGGFSLAGHRLVYGRLPPGLPHASLVVGCSQRFVARDMQRIDRLVGGVALLVLLAAPLAGHFLTGRAIRPLAQMIRTTSRLRPGELDERLPLRGSGDELDSLAGTINGLVDRIADHLKQEHDFLASAAHELRTPLAAIRSSVEVALSSDRSSEEYRELLGLVIEQCAELQTLVNQLLLLAETDADRLRGVRQAVPLDDVARRAVAMFEGVAESHGINLRLECPEPVRVASIRHHVRQLLNNLLDNAIKFSALKRRQEDADCQPSSEVLVTIEVLHEQNRVRLSVRDAGIGIAAEDLPLVFNRFFRVDKSRARDPVAGGTGLGLSICKAIVEAHHGSIDIASQPGAGTIVVVTLPLADASLTLAEAAPPYETRPDGSRPAERYSLPSPASGHP